MADETLIVYKTLNRGNESQNMHYVYPDECVPGDYDGPAQELPAAEGTIAVCSNGWHGWLTLERAKQGLNPVYAQVVYEMEIWGDISKDDSKACGRHARLLRKVWDKDGEVLRLADLVWQ